MKFPKILVVDDDEMIQSLVKVQRNWGSRTCCQLVRTTQNVSVQVIGKWGRLVKGMASGVKWEQNTDEQNERIDTHPFILCSSVLSRQTT